VRPWNIEGLAAVHLLAACGASLSAIADATNRFSSEIDRALWTLLGRSPADALAILNTGLDRQPVPVLQGRPQSSVLNRFIRETHL
jgi:hypothetical protein